MCIVYFLTNNYNNQSISILASFFKKRPSYSCLIMVCINWPQTLPMNALYIMSSNIGTTSQAP